MKLGLILGDCLFPEHALGVSSYVMIEDYSLCTHYRYHKHKIMLFLSAMRLHAKTIRANYYTLDDTRTFEEKLLEAMNEQSATTLVTYEITDLFFKERIEAFVQKHNFDLEVYPSQGFLTSVDDYTAWLGDKKPFMHSFYIWQRKRLNILLDGEEPVGGQWSFDKENRKPLPKGISLPSLPTFSYPQEFTAVQQLVEERFSDHPGTIKDFFLPVTREDALVWLEDFFAHRFEHFGAYEDAIAKEESFLFHSLLSPLLNCGLLTIREVVEKTIEQDVPLNSKEGFIRQLIGWREFIRLTYLTQDFSQNFFSHKRKLTKDWYEGTTGIAPLDDVIKKVQRYGYAHHIERLMVVGNIMLLSEIDPQEVYRWFMELFIDSADWVMVPNVFGMSQFADGGSFATKPYVCASNYILKMSDYKKNDWCVVLDGLFWRFLKKNKPVFEKNYRMRMLLSTLEKKDRTEQFLEAEKFLQEKTK